MVRAIEAAGGVRALARRLSCDPTGISRLRRVPRGRLFDFARATGLDAEDLRPDLSDWIEAERRRAWLDRARSRFSLAKGVSVAAGEASARIVREGQAAVMDLLDLGLVVAAMRFVATEKGLATAELMRAPVNQGGAPSPEQSARSMAMALAVTVGRVSPEVVASIMGVTRQAVNNAAERYLRARDGDDPEDCDAEGRVFERGRLRYAKAGNQAMWDTERRFVRQLAGGEA